MQCAVFRYGGKFGVETDRMDKSAVGHDYIEKVTKIIFCNLFKIFFIWI